MLRHSLTIARHEFRTVRREPDQLIQTILMPVVMIAFLTPAFAPVLESEGYGAGAGADHAVPGMIVMFSFITTGYIAFGFFREHGWKTWSRLRASQASATSIALGKVVPAYALALLQQAFLFTVGAIVFGLTIRGSVGALVIVGLANATTLVCLGLLFAAVFRTAEQLNAATSALTVVLAGLGGAFTPLEVLPGWAQAIAPVTPTYWVMQGYSDVILRGDGVVGVLPQVGMLLAFAAVFLAIAVNRFAFDETKRVAV